MSYREKKRMGIEFFSFFFFFFCFLPLLSCSFLYFTLHVLPALELARVGAREVVCRCDLERGAEDESEKGECGKAIDLSPSSTSPVPARAAAAEARRAHR